MKCWSEIQFGARGPRQGGGCGADGEEEMDGGGILIISHSQGGSRAGRRSSHRCNGKFIYTSLPIGSLKEKEQIFCPQTQTMSDS